MLNEAFISHLFYFMLGVQMDLVSTVYKAVYPSVSHHTFYLCMHNIVHNYTTQSSAEQSC